MAQLGIKHYRFSISWARILPNAHAGSSVNAQGVAFYNNLINELIKNDITPYVTLYHWDLPTQLQDSYNGFADQNRNLVADFAYYADVCFNAFGNRVKVRAAGGAVQAALAGALEAGVCHLPPGQSERVPKHASMSAHGDKREP